MRSRRRRRRLAASALLPFAATMSTAGLFATAPGLGQELPPEESAPPADQVPPSDGHAPTKTRIHAKENLLAGKSVRISGSVKPAVDGQHVVVHVPGKDEAAKTGPGGRFSVSFVPHGSVLLATPSVSGCSVPPHAVGLP